jgi:hypothetical protein
LICCHWSALVFDQFCAQPWRCRPVPPFSLVYYNHDHDERHPKYHASMTKLFGGAHGGIQGELDATNIEV